MMPPSPGPADQCLDDEDDAVDDDDDY